MGMSQKLHTIGRYAGDLGSGRHRWSEADHVTKLPEACHPQQNMFTDGLAREDLNGPSKAMWMYCR